MKELDYKEYFKSIEFELELINRYDEMFFEITADITRSQIENTFNKKDYLPKFAFTKNSLRKSKDKIKLLFLICLEGFGVKTLLAEFTKEFNKLEIVEVLDPNDAIQYGGLNIFPLRELIKKYLSVLKIQIERNSLEFYKQNIIETILKNVPSILNDFKIVPTKELDIQNLIYNKLKYIFPDIVKEPQISKITKAFKPDFGIKSLDTAIEVKFICSAKEARTFIGGLMEDTLGYHSDEMWKTFIAFIYFNDFYFTKEQIEMEFKLSNFPDNWKPIIVYGKGKRLSKRK